MRLLLVFFVFSASAFAQTGPAFQWIEKIRSNQEFFAGLGTDAQGNVYVVGTTQAAPASAAARDVFVTRLDPAGNIVYSKTFGGTGDDTASAMTVDAAGSVYVTGVTYSVDFPVTPGAYSPTPPVEPNPGGTGWTFVFRLNADGTLGYSTYFSNEQTTPGAIAVDGSGSVYVTGQTSGGLPVTPGAYRAVCDCGESSNGFFSVPYQDGFVTRFDASGSRLTYSTYLGVTASIGFSVGNAMVVAPDGSAYVGATFGVYQLNVTGSALVAQGQPKVDMQAMALAGDGSLYVAGPVLTGFQPTAGAAQANPNLVPLLPYQSTKEIQTAIVKMNGLLQQTLAATYFGGPYQSSLLLSLALDASGDLFVGGSTAPKGFPTVSPLAAGFGSSETGFAAELSGDLSKVQFSSYFGDNENFWVRTVAVGANGSLLLGGATVTPNTTGSTLGSVWVNSLSVSAPPALRLDSVQNAASMLDGPVSSGETVTVRGAGFGSDAQVLFGGVAATTIATASDHITVLVPQGLPTVAVTVHVQSGGGFSNSVLVPTATASPGLFSADGTGAGQGYILNHDGTLNTSANPAHQGDRITIFATGVGPVSFDHGYAVTATPVSVDVELFYARGVAAVMGPVAGFLGDVYQLTVYVPTMADIIAVNPDLSNFKFPPQVGVVLTIAGQSSQSGLAISIAQ